MRPLMQSPSPGGHFCWARSTITRSISACVNSRCFFLPAWRSLRSGQVESPRCVHDGALPMLLLRCREYSRSCAVSTSEFSRTPFLYAFTLKSTEALAALTACCRARTRERPPSYPDMPVERAVRRSAGRPADPRQPCPQAPGFPGSGCGSTARRKAES